MRFGDVTPDRCGAAIKRMIAIVFVALLQWNVAAAGWNDPFAADGGLSAPGPAVEKCVASDLHRAPAQRHCKHIQCCILGAEDGESLGRAIVSVLVLLDPQYSRDRTAQPSLWLFEPLNLACPVKVGSPRSPPATDA